MGTRSPWVFRSDRRRKGALASAIMSDMMSSKSSPTRRRVKVGATLDPDLVGAVDAYVTGHPGADRSAVIDEALRLWHEREQAAAMEQQLREDAFEHPLDLVLLLHLQHRLEPELVRLLDEILEAVPPDDDHDRVAWRGVRDASATRRLTRRR